MSRGAPAVDFALAGDLKIGQVGIANLRVRTLDVARLGAEMRDRVERAPNLFARAAVIVDFGGLAELPDATTARALLDALRAAGTIPVALAWGSSANEALAVELGLPLLAKFRAQYEPATGDAHATPPGAPSPAPAPAERPQPAAPARGAATQAGTTQAGTAQAGTSPPGTHQPGTNQPGLIQATPIRSGQQLYAEHRDLTVLSTVGAGAEVIADGSIHIYGALRGRALAGARDNPQARIFCREFHAELVAIAGHYKVMEDIPAELRGKAVQVWLDDDQLNIAALP